MNNNLFIISSNYFNHYLHLTTTTIFFFTTTTTNLLSSSPPLQPPPSSFLLLFHHYHHHDHLFHLFHHHYHLTTIIIEKYFTEKYFSSPILKYFLQVQHFMQNKRTLKRGDKILGLVLKKKEEKNIRTYCNLVRMLTHSYQTRLILIDWLNDPPF